ncbi:TonB family protein [bacterium]|nr:TonB family protein [bacterium]
MAGNVRNGSFIFGKNPDRMSRKTFLGCSAGSLVLHVLVLIFLGSGLWFAESHRIEFDSVQAKLVKLGEERDKKLLPRITQPKPAPKSEKKDPKPEPKKEEKPLEKPKPKPEGKANSLKPKEEPKPAEKIRKNETPKEEKKKASSLDELLSGDVMEKIKRDARAEETKEGAKDGVDDGDVTDPALALKANMYIRQISKKIKENWSIPSIISAEERKNLMTRIYFKITYSGEVYDIRIKSSSGNSVYDNSVIEAVKKTAKLPLPDDKNLKKLVLKEGFECPFTSD